MTFVLSLPLDLVFTMTVKSVCVCVFVHAWMDFEIPCTNRNLEEK